MQKFSIYFTIGLFLIACKHKLTSGIEDTVDKIINVVSMGYQEALLERNGFSFHHVELPTELMLQIFLQLPVTDIIQASRVCREWYQLSEEPSLWKITRLRIHGDYSVNEATKEQTKLHMLRVHVNTLIDLNKIQDLISKYGLNKNRPFVRYQPLICLLVNTLTREILDEQAAKGNQVAIKVKINRLADGEHGYIKDCEAAVAYNEALINEGNQAAIQRKVKGLINGFYGYKKDYKTALAYNTHMVEQGNQKAIGIKILGLTYGLYGYKHDIEAAFSLNEYWVKQKNIKAIERKVSALTYGLYGYEEDWEEAFALNEYLINQNNQKAIRRKVDGLAYGRYGYDQDLEAAVIFNEELIKQGNEDAIIRKIIALSEAKNLNPDDDLPLYEQNLPQLKSWVEEEANKGTRWASYLKAHGLKYGILGFNKNSEAAIEYIKRYNIPY